MKLIATAVLICLSFWAQAQFITNNGIILTNSAFVTTNGDWQNDGVLINNGAIVTSENWINTGILADTSTGGFVLNYAIAKTFLPGGNSFGFLQLEGNSGIEFEGNLTLKDSLILNGGILRIIAESGSPDTPSVTMGAGSKVLANPDAYITGAIMIRKGNGNLLFPLGNSSQYLPITLYKVTGTSATVFLEDAPAGYEAGPGVDALIDFPYVWRVTKDAATDTAAYVEINYPVSLPSVGNSIVVREVSDHKYASMGARLIDNSSGRVTVKSYSRGLKGTFTVAQGFPGDFITDSLGLVSLYKSTGGAAWTNKSNWLTGPVNSWFGITVTGQSITSVSLPDNKLTGMVADPLVDILSLENVNLSNNQITFIPAFIENPEIENLNVSGNNLEFGSLETNAGLLNPGIIFNYVNQDVLGVPVDEQADAGSPYEITAPTDGNNNIYMWKQNGILLNTANEKTVATNALDRSFMGEYEAEISNTYFPGLTLKTAPHRVTVVATIAGRLLETSNTAVIDGQLILLKVNPIGMAYDTVQVEDVKNDGTYKMEKIILDDYVLVGQGNPDKYSGYFPTYYERSVFWEEADTLKLNENRVGLDITLSPLPSAHPVGDGELFGTLSVGDLGPGGRTQKNRIIGAGASVRRGTKTGRPTETLEGEDIVVFLYTNENGEFDFKDLEEGSYILNIQYPGVPMDKESDIYITLGPKAKRQNVQKVEALAEAGKITVKRLIIVGIEEKGEEQMKIYPNPVAEELFIEMEQGSGEGIAVLTDMMGREYKRIQVREEMKVMNVRDLTSGIYVLTIHHQGQQISRSKIVIK